MRRDLTWPDDHFTLPADALKRAPESESANGWGIDRELDCPKRPCARCGKKFQPTQRRRMLCGSCFADDSNGHGRVTGLVL